MKVADLHSKIYTYCIRKTQRTKYHLCNYLRLHGWLWFKLNKVIREGLLNLSRKSLNDLK